VTEAVGAIVMMNFGIDNNGILDGDPEDAAVAVAVVGGSDLKEFQGSDGVGQAGLPDDVNMTGLGAERKGL
jgi:hypothetical protein